MGERTQFVPGAKAPNDGIYMEIGEDDYVMGINNPKIVKLKKGDKFPETTNKNRHWINKKKHGRKA
ncbi:YjzC family protein [Paenibacillus turpanensis]|uniref:YjzC family protein n=1 Tax=Paenibacillus turpanensis TaxID=2689078 RepID=UPI001408CBA8|nr:YjzC family protein [Paenibacillus turpanensis]